MVVDKLKKRTNASMKDHFLDNWANLKSATQIAELFDNYEDIRKVNSKPMDRLGASVPESTRERTFEKCVMQRCYHCNMPGHIKAVCPKLIKNKTTETLNNIEGNENPDFLNSYATKGSVNGHEIDILRDKGATIDLVCAKYINPSSFSGENVWCQRAGKPNDKKKAPLKLVPVIQEVFTKLNIDACGPLPITSKGNRYLITAICMSSKFPEAIPVSDISSVSVTDALLNIFSRMGFPREIQCDQGTSFTSALTTEFFERFGILVRHSSVYHPQSNPVERFHRTLKRLLRVLCLDAGSEWWYWDRTHDMPAMVGYLNHWATAARLRMGQTSSVNSFSVTNCISRKYRVYTVRVGVWEKFVNPRDVSNGTLDGTGRRG
ncbi:retrovirus-related Pol polyprotein from transposon 297 [Trichonephila clavipes]|nr:retrovirus-related Pol polyprotein from transposon 297 [Trichonephila clavipes]